MCWIFRCSYTMPLVVSLHKKVLSTDRVTTCITSFDKWAASNEACSSIFRTVSVFKKATRAFSTTKAISVDCFVEHAVSSCKNVTKLNTFWELSVKTCIATCSSALEKKLRGVVTSVDFGKLKVHSMNFFSKSVGSSLSHSLPDNRHNSFNAKWCYYSYGIIISKSNNF